MEKYFRDQARKAPKEAALPEEGSMDSVAAAAAVNGKNGKPWSVTVSLDLALADPETLTADICRQVGVSRSQIAAQFAFVPCETYSVADYCNFVRGFFYRDHADPERPPRKDLGPKRDKAVLHDTLVDNVLSAWLVDRQKGYRYKVFMENPRGMLQYRPFVIAKAAALGLTKSLVCYCAYSHPFKKPTNIWSNSSWQPMGNTGNGRCQKKCMWSRKVGEGEFSSLLRLGS